MIYLVCLAMFVILGAWLVSVYSRFNHLYARVQESWKQWADATKIRNSFLGDFTRRFSAELPKDSVLPRDLRRLLEDSSRALQATTKAPEQGGSQLIGKYEKLLRQVMASSVIALENNPVMRDDHRLSALCRDMSVSLVQQDQFARFYNRHAGLYNEALNSPGGRLFGSMMGFSPVERL